MAVRLAVALAAAALLLVGAGGVVAPAPLVGWATVEWGETGYFDQPPPCGQVWTAGAEPQAPCAIVVASAQAAAEVDMFVRLNPPSRPLDFNRYVAVAVFSGIRESASDQIEIRSIRQLGRTLRVGATVTSCSKGLVPSVACSSQARYVHHAVKVPRSSLRRPYPTRALVESWQRPRR